MFTTKEIELITALLKKHENELIYQIKDNSIKAEKCSELNTLYQKLEVVQKRGNSMYIKIKLEEGGKKPTYAEGTPAGMDCYSNESINIPKGTRKLVKLGFSLEIPNGWQVVIYPRSGYTKKGIDVGIGTIDSDYRGEVHAQLINNSGDDFFIKRGDRICQIKAEVVNKIVFEEVKELNDTTRGSGGFGHTGN